MCQRSVPLGRFAQSANPHSAEHCQARLSIPGTRLAQRGAPSLQGGCALLAQALKNVELSSAAYGYRMAARVHVNISNISAIIPNTSAQGALPG